MADKIDVDKKFIIEKVILKFKSKNEELSIDDNFLIVDESFLDRLSFLYIEGGERISKKETLLFSADETEVAYTEFEKYRSDLTVSMNKSNKHCDIITECYCLFRQEDDDISINLAYFAQFKHNVYRFDDAIEKI